MSATWFVADLHFGHEKVSQIRGFKTTEHHDDAVFDSWLGVVKPYDKVYILGDISGGSSYGEEQALYHLRDLPGEKHLIAGNHDSVASIHRNGHKRLWRFLEVFESVRDFARIRLYRRDVLLSHYPYAYEGDGKDREQKTRYEQFRLPFLGAPLVHGHTHSTVAETDEFQYCVSWDAKRGLTSLRDIENHFFRKDTK